MRILVCTLGLILISGAAASGEEPTAAKAKTPVTAAAATTTDAAAPSAKPKVDWKAMDKTQRKSYMKKVVLPAAQKLFAEYDAKKYKKVTCLTCHGDGAEKDFKMPNPGLPKLPSTPAGFGALQQKKPEAMKFMATKVKPAVAALLGMPEFIPGKQEGFGCHGCHTVEESAAPAPSMMAPPHEGKP